MISLINILKDILEEAKKVRKKDLNRGRSQGHISNTVQEGIKNSIKNRWLVYINYQGDEEQSAFSRWCEPYVLGIREETDNLTLRCYIYKGKTMHPNKFPGWRTVRLDRIQSMAPLTNSVFNKPRPLYNPDDKQMSKIIERVNFDNEPPTEKGTEPPVDINSPEIKKTAGIIRSNTHDNKVDFEKLEKAPEFRDSKMKRALQVLKHIILKAGKGILKGLQNLHLKEDVDETN